MSGNEITYPTGQAAQKLGVSVDTLYRWEREGKLVPSRNAAGHRRYTEKDIADGRRRRSAAKNS